MTSCVDQNRSLSESICISENGRLSIRKQPDLERFVFNQSGEWMNFKRLFFIL